MKIHEEKILIYALCDCIGRIRYVGQTVHSLDYRYAKHCHNHPERKELRIRLLRTVNGAQAASRLELQIIRACKRQGLADLNKSGARFARPYRVFNPVLWVERGLVFLSTGHAARFFNCCPQRIHKAADRIQVESFTLERLDEQTVLEML